ncbi:cytochrome [Actinosynnema sp. ALI-1.44]|uniref:cytochrome P450 n=1 Tax=Actinosynnema sp. ALI-1.44 TaxID=1933779 RepID=UPI00097C8473|nr:cytochrome P450 [Actinosynnema sp. ALI-1.44]ONI87071.1 cytochrome [Actinosynnema sp. ALI-1.44]
MATPEQVLPHYPFSDRGDRLAPELSDLQRRCPVAKVRTNAGGEAWLVTGYDLARHVLRERRFGRQVLAEEGSPVQDAPILAPELMGAMDYLHRAGLRDEVLKALGRHQPDLPSGWVAHVTRAGLDAMTGNGDPGDLHRYFAEWVASHCMHRLLGLPIKDHHWLAPRADLDLTMKTPTNEELARNWDELRDYMLAHIRTRLDRPRGLLDRIAVLNDRHRVLDDVELANIAALLYVSGYEDFASFLGVAVVKLLEQPTVMDTLRHRPDMTAHCVEELLRCSVVLGNAIQRYVTEDGPLGDVFVRQGDLIMVSLDAVNFDPAAFAEPEVFDPARSPNPHLRFGYGRHHCPGGHLVRRQSAVAIQVLVHHLPRLRLAVPVADIAWAPNRMAIIPERVPVYW